MSNKHNAHDLLWFKKTAILAMVFFITFLTGGICHGQELTLEKAIEMSIENNRSFAEAKYLHSESNWGVANSVSTYLPKVYYKWSWSTTDDETFDEAEEYYEFSKLMNPDAERSLWEDNYSNSVSVIQPIFNGGGEIVAIHAAALTRKGAIFSHEDAGLQLVLSVKTAFYNVLKADSLVKVTKDSEEVAQNSLKLAKSRFEIGSATKSDVLRWEAEVATAQGMLAAQQNAYAQAMMELAR